MSAINTSGLGVSLWVQWRTGWKGVATWLLGITAVVLLTTVSISGLYDTPEKVASYGASLGGGAVRMLNGDVAGVDTLGGVIANELGFVLSFAVPLLAVALVSRGTRREEEAGRLELLLASRVGHQGPLVAAVLVALTTLAALAVLVLGALVAAGADTTGSVWFAGSVWALGAVHVGVTAVVAQLVAHQRSVWGAGLSVILLGYLLRGIGAARQSDLVWFTPHGWYDAVAAFGEPDALPFVLSGGATLVLLALALGLSTRRDVGASLLPPRAGSARAGRALTSPLGLAARDHRGATIGWAALVGVLMLAFGSLTQVSIDAITGNPDLAAFLIGGPDQLVESMMAMFTLLLAMLVAAYTLQALGSLRPEETSGRLELQLSAPRGRPGWLAPHLAVIAVGTLVVGTVGAVTLALAASVSLGDASWFAPLATAGAAHLPVLLLFLGLSVALFGWLPRAQAGVAWGVFAVSALLAYMGPGLDLPTRLVEWSPFGLVGSVPLEDLDVTGALVAGVGGLVLLGLGVLGFARRDVPHG